MTISAEETEAIGAELAAMIEPGDVVPSSARRRSGPAQDDR